MESTTCLYCGNQVPANTVNAAGYHCYPANTSQWKNQADVQPLPDAAMETVYDDNCGECMQRYGDGHCRGHETPAHLA